MIKFIFFFFTAQLIIVYNYATIAVVFFNY